MAKLDKLEASAAPTHEDRSHHVPLPVYSGEITSPFSR
jgi:hypothetical protein